MKYALAILLSLVVTTTAYEIVAEEYTNKCDITGRSTIELKIQFYSSEESKDFKFLLTDRSDNGLELLVSCTKKDPDSQFSESMQMTYICSFWTHDGDYDIKYAVKPYGDY